MSARKFVSEFWIYAVLWKHTYCKRQTLRVKGNNESFEKTMINEPGWLLLLYKTNISPYKISFLIKQDSGWRNSQVPSESWNAHVSAVPFIIVARPDTLPTGCQKKKKEKKKRRQLGLAAPKAADREPGRTVPERPRDSEREQKRRVKNGCNKTAKHLRFGVPRRRGLQTPEMGRINEEDGQAMCREHRRLGPGRDWQTSGSGFANTPTLSDTFWVTAQMLWRNI